ncbi:MAG: hypothetical protein AAF544_11655, partial [Bacteroidota bacterium]
MSKLYWHILSIILLAATQGYIYSQVPPYFNHLNVEDGLSENTISQIFQASNNLVYLGTSAGLNVYDGARIEVINRYTTDQPVLKSNSIMSCCMEQSNGDIWFSTNSELARYRPLDNSIISIGLDDSSSPYYLLDLEADRYLWFSYDSCTYRLDTENLNTSD